MTAPRHVGLNALFLAPGASGGPETYLRGLVPALAAAHPDVRFTVYTTRSGAQALRADGWEDFTEVVALPCEEGQRGRRLFAEQVLLPRAARRDGCDLLHSLASVAPVRARMRTVVTLHDVTFILRRTFSAVTTVGMRAIITRATRRADALVAVSAAARDEICAVLDLDPQRFVVAPNGVALPERRPRAPGGSPRVVLNVAAKRPHKNQELLVRAATQLGEGWSIVLAGHAEPYAEQLQALVTKLKVGHRVTLLDYVPDDELDELWSRAACAAFPTLGEGFGIPVLEALARGVPVACSDLPVLREVGGDVPHFFDPADPVAAAAAIRAAADDAERAAVAGPERAATFTWEASAAKTFEAYERACASA